MILDVMVHMLFLRAEPICCSGRTDPHLSLHGGFYRGILAVADEACTALRYQPRCCCNGQRMLLPGSPVAEMTAFLASAL